MGLALYLPVIVTAQAPVTPPQEALEGDGATRPGRLAIISQAVLASGIEPPGGSQRSRKTTSPSLPSSGPKAIRKDVGVEPEPPDPMDDLHVQPASTPTKTTPIATLRHIPLRHYTPRK